MYILFDIGATNIRVAFSPDGETFEEPIIKSTPQVFEAGIILLRRMATEVAKGRSFRAIAGGVAGAFNKHRTTLMYSPHLLRWVNQPIKEKIEKEVKCPVYLENDSSMVALGEAMRGGGRGYPIVAYLTVSTGVGGARIVDGKLDESVFDFEPGHMIIDPDQSMCPECESGTLESYVSGSALERRFKKKPYEILDPRVWDKLAQYLAYGVNNIIVNWSPDIVVIGGSMMKKIGISVERTQEHLEKILKVFPICAPLKRAELGDFGGLYGALVYVKQKEKLIIK